MVGLLRLLQLQDFTEPSTRHGLVWHCLDLVLLVGVHVSEIASSLIKSAATLQRTVLA